MSVETICLLCHSSAALELDLAKPVCLVCAATISAAYQKVTAKPERRRVIWQRFTDMGLIVMPTDQRLIDIAEHASDEQIDGAIEIAKKSNALSVPYIAGILRKEREKQARAPVQAEQPKASEATRQEPWQREGFASEADMLKCQDAYQQEKFRRQVGRCMKWPDFRAKWQSEAL